MKYILLVCSVLLTNLAEAKDVYDCKYLCGFDDICSDYTCCAPWHGYIESLDSEDAYRYVDKSDKYAFYKTEESSWWNKEKLVEYTTRFKGVDNQILTIDKDKKIVTFDDGPDHTVVCIARQNNSTQQSVNIDGVIKMASDECWGWNDWFSDDADGHETPLPKEVCVCYVDLFPKYLTAQYKEDLLMWDTYWNKNSDFEFWNKSQAKKRLEKYQSEILEKCRK